jgi:diadenosine tetraphosphate (Ap4A) HIT family hydrolase
VFCAISTGDRDATVLHETDRHICFLDKYPVTDGHALACPKAHVQGLESATDLGLDGFLEEAVTVVRRQFTPDGMNVGVNDGAVAGQTIPHLHWHIIPRYDGDVADPTGGVRGVIPDKRTYPGSTQ